MFLLLQAERYSFELFQLFLFMVKQYIKSQDHFVPIPKDPVLPVSSMGSPEHTEHWGTSCISQEIERSDSWHSCRTAVTGSVWKFLEKKKKLANISKMTWQQREKGIWFSFLSQGTRSDLASEKLLWIAQNNFYILLDLTVCILN